MRGSKISKLRAAALAAVGALAVSACTPPGLDSLPLPAPNMGSQSYKLTARFANALNLPAKAKVRLGGADVGEVESMDAVDYVAVVQLRIREGVRLPVGTTAQLRTATPLGDVFVAVTPPATPSGQLLKDGGTLDLDNTSSAATVEGVLASAAVLVNGGVIRNLTHVVNGLGKSSGGNGSNGIVFGDIVKQSDQLMGTLNGRSAQIQNSLDKTSQLASTLSAREKTINDLLESGAPALKAIDPHQVTDLADTAGHISDQLAKFPSIQGTDSRSMITDFNTVARAFNDVTVSPDTSLVALNRLLPILIKANAGSALAVDVNMAKLALGNWPDAGYKGDPTFHGPKQADWGYLVGSFKYSLYRLQPRPRAQQLVSAALGGLTEYPDQTDRRVAALPLGGGQHLTQLVGGGLEEHRRQLGVLGDYRAVTDSGTVPVVDELYRRHREHVARDHARGDGTRNAAGVLRLQIDVHNVRLAVFGGCHRRDGPDQHAAELHVRAFGQSIAHVHELRVDLDGVFQIALGLGEQQPGHQAQDRQHRHTGQQQGAVGPAATARRERTSTHVNHRTLRRRRLPITPWSEACSR